MSDEKRGDKMSASDKYHYIVGFLWSAENTIDNLTVSTCRHENTIEVIKDLRKEGIIPEKVNE